MKKYDITYTTEVDTEHPIWAKPYAEGTLKVLFLPSVMYGREMIELAQRMDVEFETVTVDKMWDLNKWGLGDYYDIRGAQWDFSIMYQNIENVITSDLHFDTLIIPGLIGWGYYTTKTREAILRRVEQGAGLVLMKPFHGAGQEKSAELELLSPMRALIEEGLNHKGYPKLQQDQLVSEPWKATGHYITDGIPLEILPYQDFGIYPYEAVGDVILSTESGLPIAAVKEYGKGRIVSFGYFVGDILPQHKEYLPSNCFDSNMEMWKGARHSLSFRVQEYLYGLVARSVIWAARKEPNCTIEEVSEIIEPSLAVAGSAATRSDALSGSHSLTVRTAGDATGCTLQYTIKDDFDHIVTEGKSTESLELPIPEALKLGGQYRVDVQLKRGDKVVDWSTKVLSYPLTSQITELTVDQEIVKPGDRVTGKASIADGQGEVILKLVDYFGYVHYERAEAVSGNQSITFEVKVPELKSLYLRIEAELRKDGHLINKKTKRVFTPASDRKIRDFEVFLVPQNRGAGDFTQLVGERFRDMGITGLFPGSNKLSALSGVEGMGVYWYNRPAYTERKDNYLRTKDKSHLHRKPCFNDPEFWTEIREKVHMNVSVNKNMRPISYFANDEGSITCYTDEQDLCFCPHCMKGMQSWLADEYGDLHTLNNVWETTYSDWSEAIPYTFQEARKAGDYASWGDHRRFMEMSFAGAYEKISQYIKEADSEGVTRLSGCQASTTYSGYDYYQLHKHIGYVEAYSVGHQIEMHRSFAKPDTVIGGWHGYGNKGTAVTHYVWSAMFHRFTLISLFHDYSFLNPDFSYSQSAKDFGRNIKEVRREGIGKLLLYTAKRDHLGIALHYSMNSVHGSYIREDHIRFEQNRTGWIRLLEDMGYQYQMVATPQIEAGELVDDGYKMLILPYSIALSEKEATAIKKFVEAGGMVIGDFQSGIMDEHCKLYDHGKLDDVFGVERLTTDSIPFFSSDSCAVIEDFPYFKHKPGYKVKGEIANGIGASIAESGIRTSIGKSAFVDDFMRRIAQVTVNECGNGKGVYLNFALDKYSDIRSNPNGEQIRALFKKIFDLSAVQKFATLKSEEGADIDYGYESFYFSDGDAKYMGVLRNVIEAGKAGNDGVMLGGDSYANETVERIVLEFAQLSHVYDVRKKRYVGYTDRVVVDLMPGETALFSLLPTEKERILVDMDDSFHRGGEIEIQAELAAGSSNPDYSSVCSLSFYDPDGNYSWIYSDNKILKNNKLSAAFRIPLNEKTGTWKLVAKDVASGICTEKTFEIV